MDTGYLIIIDTNCINARQRDPALNELERFLEEDNIGLETTDTLLNELERNKGYPKGQQKAGKYIFSMGPMVLGHSKFGTSILGSEEDDNRLGEVLKIIFGHKSRSSYSADEMGDAVQVSTAIRYGAKFFVTRDGDLLRKSNEIKDKFEVTIINPEECVSVVKSRLAKLSKI